MITGAAAEYERAAIAFQVALAELGANVAMGTMGLFRRYPVKPGAALPPALMTGLLKLTRSRSSRARNLAFSYFRYVRAMQTGSTVARPGDDGRTVRLGELRKDFSKHVAAIVPASTVEAVQRDRMGERFAESNAPDRIVSIEGGDVTDVVREDVEREPGEVRDRVNEAVQRANERAAKRADKEEAAEEALRDERERDREREERRRDRWAGVGSIADEVAAELEKHVLDEGRETTRKVSQRSGGVLGYVRRSLSGTPCGFCGMLISRGLFFYSSAESAGVKSASSPSVRKGNASPGDKYHKKCRCVAEPVYSRAHYLESPLFAQNREFSDLWPKVTKGTSGRGALNAWRRYLDVRFRKGSAPSGAAVKGVEAA